MAKLMAPNIRIDWYPEGHFADPEYPTIAELNSGYNLSPAIVTGYTLDFTDSDTVDTANIYNTFASESFTHHNYEANLQFFLAPRGSKNDSVNENAYREAERLFYYNQNVSGYFVKRFGYKWDVEYKLGQKIDIFYFQSTIPKVVTEEDNPILLEVTYLPLGMAVSRAYAGIRYAWLGVPHNSYSVKYVNGNQVAENIWPNPQFQYSIENSNLRPTNAMEISTVTNASGGKALKIYASDDLSTYTLLEFAIYDHRVVQPGNYLAVRLEGLQYLGFHGAVRWRVGTLTNDSWDYGLMTEPDDSDVVTGTWLIPEGTAGNHAKLVLYFREWLDSPLTAGQTVLLDRVHFAVDSTESSALAQVETYFDGDGGSHG